jgi:hypothetical protein
VDDSKHKWSSGAVLLSGTLLSVTYDDMLASCDGVNVFGRRCTTAFSRLLLPD